MMNIHEEHALDVDGNDILLELSLSNLRNNVKRNFDNKRENKSVKTRIANYQAIPSVADRTITFKTKVVGETANYNVTITFTNVKFANELQSGYVQIKAVDGSDYIFKQFTLSQTQARVSCNCLDFYYRFSVWNHSKNSLDGDPPQPYVKVTDRPPVNPNKVPGACKHIMKFMAFLKSEGIAR